MSTTDHDHYLETGGWSEEDEMEEAMEIAGFNADRDFASLVATYEAFSEPMSITAEEEEERAKAAAALSWARSIEDKRRRVA